MAYLDSNKVKVYPTAYRNTENKSGKPFNPESRLNTEHNITEQAHRLVSQSKVGFVQSYDKTKKVAVVCIKGYWFELDLSSYLNTLPDTASFIYATIEVKAIDESSDPNNIKYRGWTLASIADDTNTFLDDMNEQFTGIEISTSVPSHTSTDYKKFYTLPVLYRGSLASGWDIIPGSQFKFTENDIQDSGSTQDISQSFTSQLARINTIRIPNNSDSSKWGQLDVSPAPSGSYSDQIFNIKLCQSGGSYYDEWQFHSVLSGNPQFAYSKTSGATYTYYLPAISTTLAGWGSINQFSNHNEFSSTVSFSGSSTVGFIGSNKIVQIGNGAILNVDSLSSVKIQGSNGVEVYRSGSQSQSECHTNYLPDRVKYSVANGYYQTNLCFPSLAPQSGGETTDTFAVLGHDQVFTANQRIAGNLIFKNGTSGNDVATFSGSYSGVLYSINEQVNSDATAIDFKVESLSSAKGGFIIRNNFNPNAAGNLQVASKIGGTVGAFEGFQLHDISVDTNGRLVIKVVY